MPSAEQSLFSRAQASIPGGVNSPVRAFASVGGEPPFIESAHGAYLTDSQGQRFLDYVGSWGPMILGHSHPAVVAALKAQAERGSSFGAPTENEIELAERVCQLIPSIDKVRLVNSGTEATMTALRLARGFTGRNKFIKFNGCYHGHSDALLVEAGSGVLTLGIPGSPGVPSGATEDTLTAEYNDLEQVAACFAHYADEIAAVILEPIAGNMGMVLPEPGFLQGLKALCEQHGALLIFDEVMTGFRVALGGAQSLYQVTPDLTTLGKVIGGGLPVGAVGGRADVMDHIAPQGPVYQAGTLSGNPLATAAGIVTLDHISQPGFYEALDEKTAYLSAGLKQAADAVGIPLTTEQAGGMFGFCFHRGPNRNLQDVKQCQLTQFNHFFHGMLAKHIYLAPSAFEAGFVSMAHTQDDIQITLDAAQSVLVEIAEQQLNKV